MYDAASNLDDTGLRALLLTVEGRRPRIFRECRQAAIRQLQEKDPQTLKRSYGVRDIDLLSYKYALQHYAPDWPAWLIRFPLRIAS